MPWPSVCPQVLSPKLLNIFVLIWHGAFVPKRSVQYKPTQIEFHYPVVLPKRTVVQIIYSLHNTRSSTFVWNNFRYNNCIFKMQRRINFF